MSEQLKAAVTRWFDDRLATILQDDPAATEVFASKGDMLKLVDEIATELGWRPIETAPKDGREFLACYARQGCVVELVRWNRPHEVFMCKGEHIPGFMSNATHWMPLPEPPKATP